MEKLAEYETMKKDAPFQNAVPVRWQVLPVVKVSRRGSRLAINWQKGMKMPNFQKADRVG